LRQRRSEDRIEGKPLSLHEGQGHLFAVELQGEQKEIPHFLGRGHLEGGVFALRIFSGLGVDLNSKEWGHAIRLHHFKEVVF